MVLPGQLPPTPRNRLLAALPPEDLARLWPRLEAVELPLRRILHAAGEPIGAVFFPESGYASMLATLEDGDAAEVGLIGCEGMVGLPVLLGADHDDLEAMVQNAGAALRLSKAAFARSSTASPPSAPSCSATRWSTTGRWRALRPATGATTPTSASRAGC
jgi:CRP-like cAMP-binding protein